MSSHKSQASTTLRRSARPAQINRGSHRHLAITLLRIRCLPFSTRFQVGRHLHIPIERLLESTLSRDINILVFILIDVLIGNNLSPIRLRTLPLTGGKVCHIHHTSDQTLRVHHHP